MNDHHRQQLQDAIKDSRHPYSYVNFVRTIDAIVHRWGPSTQYEPGWTPLQWANDLESKFTREVWEHQEVEYSIQQKLIEFLKKGTLAPNVYSKDFPSVERLRWFTRHCVIGLKTEESSRRDSWIRRTTLEDFVRIQQREISSIRLEHLSDQALGGLLDDAMKSLRRKRDSSVYQTWYKSIVEVIELHRKDCRERAKLPEVIGAVRACCTLVEKANRDRIDQVVETVLKFILPSFTEFAFLSGLVVDPEESDPEESDPEEPEHDPFVAQNRRRSQSPHVRPHSVVHAHQDPHSPNTIHNEVHHPSGDVYAHHLSQAQFNSSLQEPHANIAHYPFSPNTSAGTPSDGLDLLIQHILNLYEVSYDVFGYYDAQFRLKILINGARQQARHHRTSEPIEAVRRYLETLSDGGVALLPAGNAIPSSLGQLGRCLSTHQYIDSSISFE